MLEPPDAIAQLARMWPLLGRCIAFHKRLVDLTSSVKASLMLSQAIYWTRHSKDIRQAGGWFFKTVEQWHRETGLSRHEQASARAALRELGVIKERKQGLPAKLYFRLEGERLAALLSEVIGRQVDRIDWDDQGAVSALLGPVIAFHRCLSSVTGSTNAALFLSRAIYFARSVARRRAQPWFARSAAEWEEETGLSRREQVKARAVLRDLAIVEETLKGVPPQLITRVNVDRLTDLLHHAAAGSASKIVNLYESGNQGCGNPAFKDYTNRQTRMRESRNQIWRKVADKVAGKRHDSQPNCAKLYKEKLITSTVSTPPLPPTLTGDGGKGVVDAARGGVLIFPQSLLPEERIAAEALVMRSPHLAQAMLDELAGRMNVHAVRMSPISYLRGILKRAQVGEFVPEVGVRIAAARLRHQEEAAVRQQEEAEHERLNADRESPEYQAKVAKRQTDVRTMLEAMKKRVGSG